MLSLPGCKEESEGNLRLPVTHSKNYSCRKTNKKGANICSFKLTSIYFLNQFRNLSITELHFKRNL